MSSAPPPAAAAPARPVATATPVARSGDDTDALAVVLPGESDARRNLMIGAGIFVVAIVVIMFFMLSGGDDDADPSIASAPSESDPALAAGAAERTEELVDEAEAAEEAEASDEAIAAEQAEADEAAAEEPEPVTYQLSVRTVPPGASLTLDGQPVANPLSRAVEADEEEHRLVATAEGYEEASATLRFDGDHERVLTLEAEPPPPPVAMAEPAVMEAPPTMRASRRTTRRASMRTSMRTTASMRRSRMSRGAGFTTSNPY